MNIAGTDVPVSEFTIIIKRSTTIQPRFDKSDMRRPGKISASGTVTLQDISGLNIARLLNANVTSPVSVGATATTFTLYGDAVSGSDRVKVQAANCFFTQAIMMFGDANTFIDSPLSFEVEDPDSDLTLFYTDNIIVKETRTKTHTTDTYPVLRKLVTAWKYSKAVTVTNSSGGTLTNYQISFVVDTAALISAGKMQSLGQDIRVRDSTKANDLNFWIETGTINTTTTRIWAKIASLPTGDTTIYLWYGNPNATSASNGENTFPFFDDFPGTTLDTNKWGGNTTDASVSGSILTITSISGWKEIYTLTTYSIPHAFRARINFNALSASQRNAFYAQDSLGSNYIAFDQYTDGTQHIRSTASGVGTDSASSWTTGSYNVVELKWKSAEVKYTQNDTQVTSSPITTNVPTVNLRIDPQLWSSGASETFKADWFLVREYTATEPTTSVGSETNIYFSHFTNSYISVI